MAYANRRRTKRYGRSRYSPSNRRVPTWIRTVPAGNLTFDATTGLSNVDLLDATRVDPGGVLGSTIVRTHVDISIFAGTLASTYGVVWFGVGLFERGVTNVSPANDYNDMDWMYIRRVGLGELAATSLASAAEMHISHKIDIKAARRITVPSQTLMLFVQPVSLSSTPVAVWNFASSVLLKK